MSGRGDADADRVFTSKRRFSNRRSEVVNPLISNDFGSASPETQRPLVTILFAAASNNDNGTTYAFFGSRRTGDTMKTAVATITSRDGTSRRQRCLTSTPSTTPPIA